ncbi:MAG TPA: acyltransferase domain-containing protein [Longilinea sp.]|nr:acyltransferase domain-containing protein [Longilinea sp.]
MTAPNRTLDLDIIGMDVASPGCEGLAAFGQSVYRGQPGNGQAWNDAEFESAACNSVQRALADAGVSAEQAATITLSPGLETVLHACQLANVEHIPTLSTALTTAQERLEKKNASAVLLVESQPEKQTIAAMVLAASQAGKTVYAVIRSSSFAGHSYGDALENAGISPEQVGLIVIPTLTASGISTAETQALLATFPVADEPSCALSGCANGLLGLVKTAWCLHGRAIPGTPDWQSPEQPEAWQGSTFYVPVASRTWFCSRKQEKRIAGLSIATETGSPTLILLSEEDSNTARPHGTLKQESLCLFPLAAGSVNGLVERMTDLQTRLSSGTSLSDAAHGSYDRFQQDKATANVRACLLASSVETLNKEISFALTGIPAAAEKQAEWQSLQGSYFTAQPLGETGDVAFVYPGAFNSYPGVGQDLFHLFPSLYDRLYAISPHMDELLDERLLYPRSMKALTPTELSGFEARLTADPIAMLLSGTFLAVFYTFIMRDIFGLHPASAFGYSLGENSMMFAGNVWTDAETVADALRESPLFHTRLAGPQEAVREYWSLPTEDPKPLWENYLLMTSPEQIKTALANEPRVFLTQINTPRQVVIGGDPDGCRRVIAAAKCSTLKAPFNYALHNPAIASEYSAMEELFYWPVDQQPEMTLYASATYQPMTIEARSNAQLLAEGLCTCLDFPRLISQVYQDGARIFIELGAGSNCTHWIDDSLNGQPHAAFSINRKGLDDYSSVLRLLARLTCHRVSVNLEPLYN